MTPYPRYRLQASAANYLRWLGGLALNRPVENAASGRGSELEEIFRGTFGVSHALAVPMARTGIYLCLKAMLTAERPEVILSPLTISDVISVVLCAGGIPVFCEVDPLTQALCPEQARKLITSRTGALLVTHLYGLMADMPALSALSREKGTLLIEDCAQALGATLDGRPAGTWGDAGVFSFGIYKNIVGLFGGMVITRDARLAGAIGALLEEMPLRTRRSQLKRIAEASLRELALAPRVFDQLTFRALRFAETAGLESINRAAHNRPKPVRYVSLPAAYLQRMTLAQQDTCVRQLARLESATRARRERAMAYHLGLAGIAIPGRLLLPPDRVDGSHAYLCFPVQSERARDLYRHLLADGRDVALPSARNCAALEAFSEFGADCPRAAETEERTLLLPTYPGYPLREVERNVVSIRRFLSS